MSLRDRIDSLRDRIAAVQRIHFPSLDGLSCDCLAPLPGGDLDGEPFRLHLADVVIRELDMGSPCITTGCRMRQIARRHAKLSSQLTDDDYDEQYDHPDYTPSWVRRSDDE